jgi:peptidoglycan/LPS O-acetylase OafA/YrhL
MSRIRGLDGLRALSIMMVLYGHAAGTRFGPSLGVYEHFGHLANLGVRIFFVISGYLITSLLLREVGKTGTLSLTNFYFRRTMRIFPAFYIFLFAIAAAQWLHWIELQPGDLLHGLTYTTNFHYQRSWWIGHIWSLSIEEQFYLLWPATMLFLGVRGGLRAALVVVFASPFVRLAIAHFLPSQQVGIGESFPTVCDTIAIGCLLAGYWDEINSLPWFRRLLRSPWFVLLPITILLLNMKMEGRLRWALLDSVINLLIAICIARVVSIPQGWTTKILNWWPLVFIGQMSYSLYLWQQPFLNRNSAAWFSAFPVNIFLAFAAALCSYYLIERPFLALRESLEKGGARSSADRPATTASKTEIS